MRLLLRKSGQKAGPLHDEMTLVIDEGIILCPFCKEDTGRAYLALPSMHLGWAEQAFKQCLECMSESVEGQIGKPIHLFYCCFEHHWGIVGYRLSQIQEAIDRLPLQATEEEFLALLSEMTLPEEEVIEDDDDEGME